MRVTVLGNSSRYLMRLGAGTSYLIETDEARILVEAGNGTHLKLARELGARDLDAVVISHFHIDTASDLLAVLASLQRTTPVFIPERATPRVTSLMKAHGIRYNEIRHAVVHGVTRGSNVTVRDATLDFTKTFHGCPGVATRISANGRVLAYLPDTGHRAWFQPFVADADLLVAHTLLLDKDAAGRRGEHNLSAGAAGRLAAAARVKRLALAHVPFYMRVEDSVAEARAHFTGDVVALAEDETADI